MKKDDPAIEWNERMIQFKINSQLKGAEVESIEVGGLYASSAIGQEYVDFLLR